MTPGQALGFGLPLLATHAASVALGRALRTYSRSRLEEVCEAKGRPGRADAIAHHDEATERAAEALGVVAGVALVALVALFAGTPPPSMPPDHPGPRLPIAAAMAVAVAMAAAVHLVSSVVGRVWAETLLDAAWPGASAVRVVAWPLTAAGTLLEELASRLARPGDVAPRPATVEVEFLADADHPEEADGDLPESTRVLLEHVVALTRRDVSEIMTPRSAIVALPASTSARAAATTFRESGLSRIPLFGENRDDILGILYAKDLFPPMAEADDPDTVHPRKLVRPAYFVPESKNASDLLGELRARRSQIAVVLDEYGGVAGLITLEDLFEELVGPIDDEHDPLTPDDRVVPLGGTRYEVAATVALEDLNDRLGLHLPTDGDFQTVGGFAFNALGRLPAAGETFQANGVEFTVLEVVDHAIRRVQLALAPH